MPSRFASVPQPEVRHAATVPTIKRMGSIGNAAIGGDESAAESMTFRTPGTGQEFIAANSGQKFNLTGCWMRTSDRRPPEVTVGQPS